MKTTLFLLFVSFTLIGSAQPIAYNDVAVIVNVNSPESVAIGNYFQQARNIPNINVISINAPTTDAIDSAQFESVRAQIENHLITNNLADDIFYLVTTKGIPLRIDYGNCAINPLNCRSVDSELTLLLGIHANEVNQRSNVLNSTYLNTGGINRLNTGIYLVTRLDGYTTTDVYELIDRSGPETIVEPLIAQAIVDLHSNANDSTTFMDSFLTPAYNYLNSQSWNTQLHANLDLLTDESNVFSYTGLVLLDNPNVDLNYTWVEGSVASVTSGTSGFTFDAGINTDDRLVMADLIAEGCTSVHGYAAPTFVYMLFEPEVFLDRYFDTTLDINLAQSYYAAEQRLSDRYVIVGDPKASVILDEFASIKEPDVSTFSVYPNPANGLFFVQLNEVASDISYTILDGSGRIIHQQNDVFTDLLQITLDESPGVYFIQLTLDGNQPVRKKIILR